MAFPASQIGRPPAGHVYSFSHPLPVVLRELAFFGCFFCLLCWGLEPKLIYHGGGELQGFPAFRWGTVFFQEFWAHPGGIAKYVSAFLTQLLIFDGSGALVLTLQAVAMYIGSRFYLRALRAGALKYACFLPPLGLLALDTGYTYLFRALTPLILSLATLAVLIPLRTRPAWIRFFLFTLLCAILYPMAGPGLTVFVALSLTLEIEAGNWRWGVLLVPIALIILLLEGSWFYGLSFREAIGGLRPLVWRIDSAQRREMLLVYGIYGFLPLLGIAVISGRSISRWFPARSSAITANKTNGRSPNLTKAVPRTPPRAKSSPAKAATRNVSRWSGALISSGLLLIAAALTFYFSLDRELKTVLAVDYCNANQQWLQAIERGQGSQNVYVINNLDRALWHANRLGTELPLSQSPNHLLLLERDPRAHWNKIDLYLDLGSANPALHHLTEAVAFYGEHPFLLRRLALANLAIGNTATARIFLRSLARTPFQSGWAESHLRRMETDPELSGDPIVGRLRALRPARDDLVPLPTELFLSALVDAHADNTMACEYLMCYYLLAKDMPGLVRNLNRLDSPDWKRRPRLYDEAALLATRSQPSGVPPRLPVAPETIARFEAFSALARPGSQTRLDSNPEVVREFGDTYFYYFFSQ